MQLPAIAIVIVAALSLPAEGLEGLNANAESGINFARKYPEFFKGLTRYVRHLRHRPRAALVHAAPAQVEQSAQDASTEKPQSQATMSDVELVNKTSNLPMALPGRHPSVEKALGDMGGDLKALKEKKLAAKEARAQLEGTVTNAVQHMNDAVGIKHAMAKTEAQLRVEDGKLKRLENDVGRLDQTHDSLVSSLRRMLVPKIMSARGRYAKKEEFLRKEENSVKAWKEKTVALKASAMKAIKKKKASYQILLEAEAKVAQAKKEEKLARMEYEHEMAETSEEVQSLRYAETRLQAELHHEHAARAAAETARESMNKLHRVFEVEQQKVEQSVGFREYRLRRKMHNVEAARQKDIQELTHEEQKYKDWQESQRKRTADVVRKEQETAKASEEFAARQKQVLDTAQHKVARAAEPVGDWEDWGNDFTKVSADSDDDTNEDANDA